MCTSPTSPRSISSERVMIVLPTMHKRIRRSFLRLVLLFGALGVLMGDRHHHCGAGSLGAHPYELRLHRLRAGDGTGHERHPVPRAVPRHRYARLGKTVCRHAGTGFRQHYRRGRAEGHYGSSSLMGMRTARPRTTPITGACTPASTPWFRSTSGACSCGSARTPGSATS